MNSVASTTDSATPIHATVFRGAAAPVPIDRAALTWAELGDEIEAALDERSADKRDMLAIGPYRLRAGTNRAARNVEQMSAAIALDLDAVPDLDALLTGLRELGLAAIVHTSPSDPGPGAAPRKVRVYLASEPHAPEHCARVRRMAAALLGEQIDGSTLNADRIFFVGALEGTPDREVWRLDGAPLRLEDLEGVAGGLVQDAPRPAPSIAPVIPLHAIRPGDAGIVDALGDWTAHEGRKNNLCLALGGIMRKWGFSKQRCASVIREWLPTNEPGVNVEHGVREATKAWGMSSLEVSGFEKLAALVGEEHATVINEACRAARWPGRPAAANDAGDTQASWAQPAGADADSPPIEGKSFAALVDHIRQRGCVAYDVRLMALVHTGSRRRWVDADTGRLRLELSAQHLEVPKEKLADAIETVGHENAFDPVVEYLESLPPWDGVRRNAFVLHFGAAPGKWADACWRVFSVSAVARAMQPGCKVDTMICLEGDQGRFKSSGLKVLAGADHFCDTMFPLDSPKMIIEGLAGVWIQEVAELSGLRGRDGQRIKASLSSAVDRSRLSYGRFAEAVPRRSIFVATNNPDGAAWLVDTTGNRRHLPLAVGHVDIEGLKRDRDQLWAEALHRYRAGEQWWLDTSEAKLQDAATAERTECDPWEDPIRVWLAKRGRKPCTIADVVDADNGAVKLPASQATQAVANRVARIMRGLGWTRRRVRLAGARRWQYEPGG